MADFKEIHKANIELHLACYDPKDMEYMCSEIIEDDFFERYPDLKLGDKIQYKIDDKTNELYIFSKVETSKRLIPVQIKN